MTPLREWRTTNALTLAEVADLTGWSIGQLSKVERGLHRVPPLGKVAMARRLGVSVADLFGHPTRLHLAEDAADVG